MNRDDATADKLSKAAQEIAALMKDATGRAPFPRPASPSSFTATSTTPEPTQAQQPQSPQISPPPPPPKQAELSNPRFMWLYQHGSTGIGPVSEDVIRQLTDTKALNHQSLVWREGMTAWVSLVEAGLIASVPQTPVPPPIAQQKQSIFQRHPSWWWTLLFSAAFYAVATMIHNPDSPSFLVAVGRMAGSIMGLFGMAFLVTGLLWLCTLCRLKDRAFMITFTIVFYAITIASFIGNVFVLNRA